MTPEERIVEVALAAEADGVGDFLDLVDFCLEHTELRDRARAADADPTEFLLFLLENTDRVRIADDDEVIRMDLLADGIVFTHRLSEAEIAAATVDFVPDLAAIDLGARNLIVPGGVVDLEFDWGDDPHLSEHGSLVGPAGWFSEFTPDQLVAFRRHGARLIVETAEEIADGEDEVAAIEHAFAAETDDDDLLGIEPGIVLEHVLLEYPDLFRRSVQPVSELLAAAGLEVDGGWVGRVGADWKPLGIARLDDLRAQLRSTYDLDDCCEEALDVIIAAWSEYLGDGPVDTRAVNRALGHGPVVEAFVAWAEDLLVLDGPSIEEFATTLASSGRRDTASALMLRARHREATGDALAAQLDLEAAVRVDPGFGPALAELAWYTSDRGDPSRTVSLLRRAGVGEDDPMLAYHAGLDVAVPSVGRNDPCPCGSGRKYKVCHLGRTQVPDDQRVNWLLSKLSTFVTRPGRTGALFGLAASAMLPDFEVEDLSRMAGDEFILELRVFEGGGVSEFLEARGALLPDDELDVLELWEMARLALWEVTATDGEALVAVRDTKTGDTLEVSDRSMARGFEPGEQLFARFLPGWGRTWASGIVIRVDLSRRDSLLDLLDDDPEVEMIARWYGGLFAPPVFANRESEPLVLCTARLRPVGGWEDLAAVLDGAYEAAEDEPGVWLDLFEIRPDERIIRASLRRDGDELEVDVNSEARLERVLTRLSTVTEVVDQTARPIRDPAELQATREDLPRGAPIESVEAVDPEVADQLVDFMERRWLDEEVPALGGMTPRRAAADPTRREDLSALLRSFERTPAGEGFTMRPDVLRHHLGLEE